MVSSMSQGSNGAAGANLDSTQEAQRHQSSPHHQCAAQKPDKDFRTNATKSQTSVSDNRLEQAEAGQPLDRCSVDSSKSKFSNLKIDTSPKKLGSAPDTPVTQPATFVFSGSPDSKSRDKSRSLCCLLKCLGPYKGPFICIVIVYVLLVSGGASYLLRKALEVPGLQDEVTRLKGEVGRLTDEINELESQIDRLEDQVDKFDEENTRLEKNNDEYAGLNQQLKSSNEYYNTMNQQLNASNQEYQSLNYKLELENSEYNRLNKVLNSTVRRLDSEVEQLRSLREDLTVTIESHEALNSEMSEEVDELQQQNGNLNRTVNTLSGEVSDLKQLTLEYKELNTNLKTVVSFLDDVSGKVDESFEGLVSFLTDMIVVYRQTAVENMHFMIETKVDNWRCRVNDAFVDEWVSDTKKPIGPDSYPQLLEFVQEEVLSEMCADRSDFESYIASRFTALTDPSNISLAQLSSAVARYVSLLKDHYFPDENEAGITEEEWEEFGFKCSNLPAEKRFNFSV